MNYSAFSFVGFEQIKDDLDERFGRFICESSFANHASRFGRAGLTTIVA